MAAALASLTNVLDQMVSITNANPGIWISTVSGKVGAFPSDAELILAALQSDEQVCVEGYFQSINDSLSNPFTVTSVPLADQDQIPFHHGTLNKVEVTKSVNALTQASITVGTDLITTPSAHGLTTGDIVTWKTISGALPTASPILVDGTNYYAVVISPTTLKIARTLADALAATPSVIDLTVAPTGSYLLLGWQIGVEADSLDSVTNAIAVGDAYVGAGSFDFLYRPQDGQIYTPAAFARVTYPEYIRTSALQARQAEEFLVTCGAIRKLVKNASPAPFSAYIEESIRGLQQLIQDGVYTQNPDAGQGGDNK